MPVQSVTGPWWAALTVWVVVNLVNLLQSAGFLSRIRERNMATNHLLGYAMIALAVPAAAALAAFARARAGWLQVSGPALYLVFIALMVAVDYAWPVEFRSPARPAILAPYLVLFFGSIVLMGLPMYELNRRLWLVTLATSVLLIGAMGIAMRKGVG
jgi:hypothetical protein